MRGLRITVCLGLILWTTLPSSAQSAPSSAPGTSASSPNVSPQAPSAPDTPVNATTPTQDGSTADGMIAPDTRPLSGAQPFTLGISGQKQMTISLHASQLWDSNPSVASNVGANFEGVTSGGGSLSLERQLQNSQTAVSLQRRRVALLHESALGFDFPEPQLFPEFQIRALGTWDGRHFHVRSQFAAGRRIYVAHPRPDLHCDQVELCSRPVYFESLWSTVHEYSDGSDRVRIIKASNLDGERNLRFSEVPGFRAVRFQPGQRNYRLQLLRNRQRHDRSVVLVFAVPVRELQF